MGDPPVGGIQAGRGTVGKGEVARYDVPMRPRLEQITIRGFKTIRELVGFVPGNLTVLIGPNGAGKSNFISFFRMLSWALAEPGQLQLRIGQQGGASSVLHRGPAITQFVDAELVLGSDAGVNEYGFRLVNAAGDILIYTSETFRFLRPHQSGAATSLGAGHREPKLLERAGRGERTPGTILGMLRRIIVHQFHNTSDTARIRAKWDVSDGRYLKEDGGNLGAFLFNLQNAYPVHYNRIVQTIRLILPFLGDFNLVDDYGRVLLQWREIGSDHILSAAQASDGMLRAMALVSLLQQPEENLPDVLILDEPELGLHPYAIEVLAALIQAASQHVQVIVATQSASLIDRFEPSDIVVVDRHAGETTLHRLNETDLAGWLEDYTLSELWDKNVLGGRPGP
jgi:predicted ATPase